ncbi:unnamed protein product [Durusdinium trenchii]|uniref:Uncharacterized protein n=1 Tax=Durusdinium trenchii TaxID=1381693 RepID=A0ABP0S2P7_9DINO
MTNLTFATNLTLTGPKIWLLITQAAVAAFDLLGIASVSDLGNSCPSPATEVASRRMFLVRLPGLRWAQRAELRQEPVKEKTAQLREGDKVQYFSTSYAQWMDTTITAMDATGAMQLQCKPGYWLPPEELHKVRRPL